VSFMGDPFSQLVSKTKGNDVGRRLISASLLLNSVQGNLVFVDGNFSSISILTSFSLSCMMCCQ